MSIELTQKIMRFGIVSFLFLCVLTMYGVDVRISHQYAFILGVIVLSSLLLRNIWLTLLLAWATFLFSYFQFKTGWNYLANIFYGCMLFYLTKVAFSKKDIDFFIKIALWVLALNVLYMIPQIMKLDFIYAHYETLKGFMAGYGSLNRPAPIGFMGNTSNMAAFIAMMIPLLATRKGKFPLIASGLLFIPLYYLHSSTNLIAAVITSLFVVFYRFSKKIFIGCVIGLVFLGGIYLTRVDGIGTERFNQWQMVLTDGWSHPVVGWGLDSFRNFTPNKNFIYTAGARVYDDGKVWTNTWDNPHNLFVSLFYEFGIVGIFLVLGLLRQYFLWFRKAPKDPNLIALAGFLIAFLVCSMGHFPIFLARTAVFIIPVVALFEVEVRT